MFCDKIVLPGKEEKMATKSKLNKGHTFVIFFNSYVFYLIYTHLLRVIKIILLKNDLLLHTLLTLILAYYVLGILSSKIKLNRL